MDVPTTEEKQRQRGKRQRSKKDCESENRFHKLWRVVGVIDASTLPFAD